jgi:periplasmic protein TonB
MFLNSLDSSFDERSRRGLTTLTSFGLQAVVVCVLLVLPLLRPQGLPLFRQLTTPVSLGQPVGGFISDRTRAGGNAAAPSHPAEIVWRQPTRIPYGLPSAGDDAPPSVGDPGPYLPGVAAGPGGVLDSVPGGTRPIMPVSPVAVTRPVRLSRMSEGDLVHKIVPMYPPLARNARIQGTVVLQAMISKQGTIENLRLLSGHPLLAPAAIEAVRQWRYRPYILNSEPVEVETQITVNFSLAGH